MFTVGGHRREPRACAAGDGRRGPARGQRSPRARVGAAPDRARSRAPAARRTTTSCTSWRRSALRVAGGGRRRAGAGRRRGPPHRVGACGSSPSSTSTRWCWRAAADPAPTSRPSTPSSWRVPIAGMPVPVIAGVGHETDRSVADEVAHTACKTPTACAQTLLQQRARLRRPPRRRVPPGDGSARRRMAVATRELDDATRRAARSAPAAMARERARLDAPTAGSTSSPGAAPRRSAPPRRLRPPGGGARTPAHPRRGALTLDARERDVGHARQPPPQRATDCASTPARRRCAPSIRGGCSERGYIITRTPTAACVRRGRRQSRAGASWSPSSPPAGSPAESRRAAEDTDE